MKRLLASFLTAATIMTSVSAHAGSFSGGGGGTVALCRDARGEVTKIGLLALVLMTQAGKQRRADLTALASEDQILDRVTKEATSAYEAQYLANRTSWFLKGASFSANLGVKPFDVNPSYVATIEAAGFCRKSETFSIRLAALQDFEGRRLRLDSFIWNHPAFGAYSRAALIYHEAWYAYLADAAGISGPERPDYLKPSGIYEKVFTTFLK